MENYLKGCIIGRGAYGIVYKVTCLKTGKAFALKCHIPPAVRNEDIEQKNATIGVEDATLRELSCLSALRGHPNVIQIHDLFMDGENIAMLMPYVPYTLTVIHNGHGLKVDHDLGKALQGIPLSFVAHFSVQVANALSYMHGRNIIHRDLKPHNVLLTKDLTVKVADMGLARQSSKRMSPNVVTEPYRAPELFGDTSPKDYTCAIDMWSLGVMIADAMEGKIVFAEREKDSGTVSTYDIIVKTLCPRNHLSAPVTSWDIDDVMPNAMECTLVRRIVLQLLAFRENERLLAHELLQDQEWVQAAHMTEEDKNVVIHQIQQQGQRQASKRF